MRVIPLLTAAIVTTGLYYAVIEREALLAFARGEDAVATDTSAEATAPVAAPATDNAEKSGAARVRVVALRSTARGIDSAVILRGQTEAARQVEVRAETTSTVVSEPLRKGAQVKAGDLLCKLDPGTRPATQLEAKARLAEAKIRVPEARPVWMRPAPA